MTERIERAVSVIIPHYNADRFLGEAIASVHAQGDIVNELIVVDDGSSEESWQRARELSSASSAFTEMWVRCSKNHGQGHALNLGIRAATGKYVALLDADDVWAVGKLRRQLGALELSRKALASAPIVCGHAENFGAQKTWPKPARLTSALFAPRHIFDEDLVGPFEESLGAGMTLEWFSRAEERGYGVQMLGDLVFYRRIHDQNYGVVHRDRAKQEYLDALKLVGDRKKRVANEK